MNHIGLQLQGLAHDSRHPGRRPLQARGIIGKGVNPHALIFEFSLAARDQMHVVAGLGQRSAFLVEDAMVGGGMHRGDMAHTHHDEASSSKVFTMVGSWRSHRYFSAARSTAAPKRAAPNSRASRRVFTTDSMLSPSMTKPTSLSRMKFSVSSRLEAMTGMPDWTYSNNLLGKLWR